MPSDFFLNTMNRLHRGLQKVTGGRLGWRLVGMPVVQLTTTGRKSGLPRTSMLTSPVQISDVWVIVASRGGDDHHPAWFLNLLANPEVRVSLEGRPETTMRARMATPGERAELWPRVTKKYRGYAGYQRRTTREIPLVLLEPR